jgi:hypothetical protein
MGNAYDYSDSRQFDVFIRTTKEITEYVGHTVKYGCNIGLAIEA